jgi:hypothetical protein
MTVVSERNVDDDDDETVFVPVVAPRISAQA